MIVALQVTESERERGMKLTNEIDLIVPKETVHTSRW